MHRCYVAFSQSLAIIIFSLVLVTFHVVSTSYCHRYALSRQLPTRYPHFYSLSVRLHLSCYISISSEIPKPKCGLRSDIPWTQHRLSQRPDPSAMSLAQAPMAVGSLMKPCEEMVGFVLRVRANGGDRRTSWRVLQLMMSMAVGSESVKQSVSETTRSIVRKTDFWIAHMQEDD